MHGNTAATVGGVYMLADSLCVVWRSLSAQTKLQIMRMQAEFQAMASRYRGLELFKAAVDEITKQDVTDTHKVRACR